ncbi:MAG: CRISPR-associated endonuclease Cas2 [Atopobiaceae bacterium]|nr:CRISPR-associated endonuclease Cas2 [Atopobiaceae bacterium]
MMTIIAYDVDTKDPAGARRLRRVAKVCVNYCQRVQNSVFECCADAATFERIKNELLSIIDLEKDSLRFYKLGNRYQGKIEQYGKATAYEPEGFIAL